MVFVTLVALAAVQFGSDAIFSASGSAYSLPARLAPALGVRVYSAIARVAPAQFVRTMLAVAALDRGDLIEARRNALWLPQSARREDLLGRIAEASGNAAAAQRHFLAADDLFAINDEVDALAARNPKAAYALESQLALRLTFSGTHPDALAQAHWRMGTLAIAQGKWADALREYRMAVDISPLSERYLLFAGFQEIDVNQPREAAKFFARAINVDPGNADAYAGAGQAAWQMGDRVTARDYALRARAIDPGSPPVQRLLTELR